METQNRRLGRDLERLAVWADTPATERPETRQMLRDRENKRRAGLHMELPGPKRRKTATGRRGSRRRDDMKDEKLPDDAMGGDEVRRAEPARILKRRREHGSHSPNLVVPCAPQNARKAPIAYPHMQQMLLSPILMHGFQQFNPAQNLLAHSQHQAFMKQMGMGNGPMPNFSGAPNMVSSGVTATSPAPGTQPGPQAVGANMVRASAPTPRPVQHRQVASKRASTAHHLLLLLLTRGGCRMPHRRTCRAFQALCETCQTCLARCSPCRGTCPWDSPACPAGCP